MVRSKDNRWLHRYALLTAAATLLLICLGGVVTSKGAGLAVPDWPTTYGYNMFFFPFSKWVGGVFYEHTHRLAASLVGLMTVILAVWLHLKEARAWLRWLGFAAVLFVIGQGVLGGLRVTALMSELGIFHATLAQLFLALLAAIALFTSRWWVRTGPDEKVIYDRNGLRYFFAFATMLILAQLILGATMRHQHAGLAIPDFPLAYGNVWPDTAPEAVARYNAARSEVTALNPITPGQIVLQMAHRLVALLIAGAVFAATWMAGRRLGWKSGVAKLCVAWSGLIFSQVLLGAATIWTNKAADAATAHVAVGALTLVTGSSLTLIAFRILTKPVRVNAAVAGDNEPAAARQMQMPA